MVNPRTVLTSANGAVLMRTGASSPKFLARYWTTASISDGVPLAPRSTMSATESAHSSLVRRALRKLPESWHSRQIRPTLSLPGPSGRRAASFSSAGPAQTPPTPAPPPRRGKHQLPQLLDEGEGGRQPFVRRRSSHENLDRPRFGGPGVSSLIPISERTSLERSEERRAVQE